MRKRKQESKPNERLGCFAFLGSAIGVPLLLVGAGFASEWWRDRGDAESRARRRAVRRAVDEAAHAAGARLLRVVTSANYVKVVTSASYDVRRLLIRDLSERLAALEWDVTLVVEAAHPEEDFTPDHEWSTLSHAYGSAGDVPFWLSKLTPDPTEEAWGELWSRLCHQGWVYSASFAALPALRDLARDWSPVDRIPALALAGGIVAGHDRSPELEQLHRAHAAGIAQLRDLTLESLAVRDIHSNDFIALLEALAAFEDIAVWNSNLDRLWDGRFEAMCPACGTMLFVAIGDSGYFTTEEDYGTRQDVRRLDLHPRNPAELAEPGRRFHAYAAAAGQDRVATQLRHLFGEGTCVHCGNRFDVAEAVARAVSD